MGQAAGSLGKGQTGPAVGSQGEALDALRQGAQGLSQQLANRQGQARAAAAAFAAATISPIRIRSAGRSAPSVPTSAPRSRFPTRSIPSAPARSSTRSAAGSASLDRPDLERDYLERLLDQF